MNNEIFLVGLTSSEQNTGIIITQCHLQSYQTAIVQQKEESSSSYFLLIFIKN